MEALTDLLVFDLLCVSDEVVLYANKTFDIGLSTSPIELIGSTQGPMICDSQCSHAELLGASYIVFDRPETIEHRKVRMCVEMDEVLRHGLVSSSYSFVPGTG